MKIGMLSDIHEDVPHLGLALGRLRDEGADRLVVLGDVFETGRQLAETVALLTQAGAGGVWGNHELGLCHRPDPAVLARYPGPVVDYMATLQPRLEAEDCLFSHGLPCWDPADPAIYYLGLRPEDPAGLASCFAATDRRVIFVGHFHRWLIATPAGALPWDGSCPLRLAPPERYLVVVGAVLDGWCADYDTARGVLTPHRLDLTGDQ
jgi:Calcineurin-like phosphoesterase superfamily domain